MVASLAGGRTRGRKEKKKRKRAETCGTGRRVTADGLGLTSSDRAVERENGSARGYVQDIISRTRAERDGVQTMRVRKAERGMVRARAVNWWRWAVRVGNRVKRRDGDSDTSGE